MTSRDWVEKRHRSEVAFVNVSQRPQTHVSTFNELSLGDHFDKLEGYLLWKSDQLKEEVRCEDVLFKNLDERLENKESEGKPQSMHVANTQSEECITAGIPPTHPSNYQ